VPWLRLEPRVGGTTISRLIENIGHFCKRAL